MKYQLETIPLWDSVEKHPDGCPLCTLMEKAEDRHVSYYLGSSVMEPSVRVRVNDEGFCPDHFRSLHQAAKPQPLALIMHTIIQQTISDLDQDLERLSRVPERAGRTERDTISRIVERISGLGDSCLICADMRSTLARYTYTFVHLIVHDDDYRRAYENSAGVCLEHAAEVFRMASQEFSAGERSILCGAVADKLRLDLDSTEKRVLWMTQKYKAEHREASWQGCEQAQVEAIDRIIGKGRVRNQDRKRGDSLRRRLFHG